MKSPGNLSITKRIDSITEIPEEYLSEIPPPPRSVKIELTARCDYNCFFCASSQRLRDREDMDLELFKRLSSKLRLSGVEELGVFYLGESFLLDWLPEAIEYAKKECRFPYVFLTTNGRLATPERVRDCIRAGLDSLKFSFNHSGETQFQEVTGIDGKNYGIVKENIRKARDVRDYLKLHDARECGIYASSILYDNEQKNKMSLAVAEILPWVDEHYYLPLYNQAALTTKVTREHGYIPTAGNQGRIGALREPIPCWSVFTEGHITYDGHLSACCFDHSTAWQMGNLNDVSFIEAWHSEPFQKLRRAHLSRDLQGTPCQKCLAYT